MEKRKSGENSEKVRGKWKPPALRRLACATAATSATALFTSLVQLRNPFWRTANERNRLNFFTGSRSPLPTRPVQFLSPGPPAKVECLAGHDSSLTGSNSSCTSLSPCLDCSHPTEEEKHLHTSKRKQNGS